MGKSVRRAEAAWTQKSDSRWERADGAVVRDVGASSPESKPWLPGHRGWMAFGPGPDEHNYLSMPFGKRFRGPRKWKTAEAAMRAVDREFPYNIGAPVPAKDTPAV